MASAQPLARLFSLAVAMALLAIAIVSGLIWNLSSAAGEKLNPLLKGNEPAVQAGIDRLTSLPEAKAKLHAISQGAAEERRAIEEFHADARKLAALTGLLSLIGLAMMWPLFRARTGRASSS